MTKANIDAIIKYLKDGLKPAEIERKLINGKKVYARDIADAKRMLEVIRIHKTIPEPLSNKPINPIKKPIKSKPKPISSYPRGRAPIKSYHKPIISFDSIDIDALLTWIKKLDPKKYHGPRRTQINRIQKYSTSSFIEGTVDLIKLYLKYLRGMQS